MGKGFRAAIKKAAFHNPLAATRCHAMRKRLANTTPTLIVPSCLGGTLFHDLGLQFRSPTINLMLFQTDFVKFVTCFDEYFSKEFEFYDDPEYDCPCAKLGDIAIHFSHYDNPHEAVSKWNSRLQRVDKSNLSIWCSERDGITREEIESLVSVKARGICVFTAHDYSDIPYCLQIPGDEQYGMVHDIQRVYCPSELKEYEKYFDWVKWFNEADGAPYDISPYSLADK